VEVRFGRYGWNGVWWLEIAADPQGWYKGTYLRAKVGRERLPKVTHPVVNRPHTVLQVTRFWDQNVNLERFNPRCWPLCKPSADYPRASIHLLGQVLSFK